MEPLKNAYRTFKNVVWSLCFIRMATKRFAYGASVTCVWNRLLYVWHLEKRRMKPLIYV